MLLCITPILSYGSSGGSSGQFVKALSEYNEGKNETAFSLFEKFFITQKDELNSKNTTKIVEQRNKSAFILSFAPNSFLKSHKRHFYAQYYLSHADQIPQKTRANLLRIVGDGYFDEMKLELALQNYILLSQDADLKNQAYAQYRMGWIDLNQQNPHQTVSRWSQFLSTQGGKLLELDRDLFLSILKDLGKAWVESYEKAEEQYPFQSRPSWLPTHSKEFEEGVALGLKRLSDPLNLEKFRITLYQTPHAQGVFEQLLKKGIVLITFPCQSRKWATPPIILSNSMKTALLPSVNACAQLIYEKKECDSQEGLLTRTFFDSFLLQGEQLLPRISLSIGCKDWARSCKDLLALATQEATKNKILENQANTHLFETCSSALTSQKKENSSLLNSTELRENFENLIEIYVQKGIYPSHLGDPIHRLFMIHLNDSSFKTRLLSKLLGKDAPFYEKTQIPEQVANQLKESESDPAFELLKLYAKKPLTGVWLNLMKSQVKNRVDSGDFEKAGLILDQFVSLNETPLSIDVTPSHEVHSASDIAQVAQNEETSTLWEYYWMNLNKKDQSNQEIHLKTWFKYLPLTSMKLERKMEIFTLLLKYDFMDLIWSHWKNFESLKNLSHSPSKKSMNPAAFKFLYENTLSALQSGSLSKELLSTSPEGKLLLRIAENDLSLHPQEIQKVLGTTAPTTGILDDLKGLDLLHGLSKKIHRESLKINSSMARILANKLKALQKEESLLAATPWSSSQAKEKAQTFFTQDCQDLVTELEALELKLSQSPDLAEASTQIAEIKSQILEKIPRGEKNEK